MDWSFLAQGLWNLLLGMARRQKTLPENVHKHEARGRILDALRRDPGKNLQRICDELNLKRGTASYHLYVLERAGAVGSVERPHTHHYFPPHAGPEERAGLAVLRRERGLEVALKVLDKPGIVQRELLAEIGMSRKVFRSYVREMQREGLLHEDKRDRHCRYTATPKLIRLVAIVKQTGFDGQPRPDWTLPPTLGGVR